MKQTLKNTDRDDIGDAILKAEESFGINFTGDELKHVTTFGALCDLISNKIRLQHTDDCTAQQAFYKLRNAMVSELALDKKTITPASLLEQILPRKTRRKNVKEFEKALGFNLSILYPPDWVTVSLLFTLFISLITIFFNWQWGLAGIVFSLSGFWLTNKICKELKVKTVGEVAVKMASEHYLKSRRNPHTINKREIEKTLVEIFSDTLLMDKSEITRDAPFV